MTSEAISEEDWPLLTLTEKNGIYHRFLMQIQKFQPESKRIMPETWFTGFPALFVNRGLGFLGLHRRPMFDSFLTYDIKIHYFIIRHFFHFLTFKDA